MQKEAYLIKEAARAVHVESHVLRYWEEELGMPIQRNEKGHRIYTESDLEQFKKVKELKEEGLQLKAVKKILEEDDNQNISFKIRNIDDYVKMNLPDKVSQILKENTLGLEHMDSKNKQELEEKKKESQLDTRKEVMKEEKTETKTEKMKNDRNQRNSSVTVSEHIAEKKMNNELEWNENQENESLVEMQSDNTEVIENQQEKMHRMKTLIKKFIADTVMETHERVKDTICQEIKEDIAKEIDYQFRARAELEEQLDKNRMDREDIRMRAMQEQEEKWEKERQKREEEHYKNIDSMMRKSLKTKKFWVDNEFGNKKEKAFK